MEIRSIHSSLVHLQALPPWHQEAREKQAILNDGRLRELLESAEVLEICKIEGGYLVMTEHLAMQVDVHYLPDKRIGPLQFELFFHQPVSR